jgi:phosphoglycolate phosphatase-like HAD superfamily hydrolase
MSLEISLPLRKNKTTKSLVFTILTRESSLKIINLTNHIRKRYGKSITFQAVRKAILELVEEGVLKQKGKEFYINKEWVKQAKQTIDKLYEDVNKSKEIPKRVEAIEDVSVFTFDSLNQLMKFWQELIDNWFKQFKKGDPKINCYQAPHAWEGLLHLDTEKELMEQLKKKGIKSTIITTGNTPLDKNILKFYKSIGVNTHISPSSSDFDKSYYVGTYGALIVQTNYPKKLVKLLDIFFKKNKSLKNFNLKELSDIVNRKVKIKLTVIKNLEMAKQINKSILNQI